MKLLLAICWCLRATTVRLPAMGLATLHLLAVAAALNGCASLPAAQVEFPKALQTGPVTAGPSDIGAMVQPAAVRNPKPQIVPGTDSTIGEVDDGAGAGTWRPKTSETSEGGVSLDLANATVGEAAKAVLGDILRLNYTVSDKLTSTVTIHTAAPVSKPDLLDIFQTALKSAGAVVVQEGDVYKVIPAEGNTGPMPMKSAWSRGPRVGVVTEVVPLRYASASDMQRTLAAISAQSSVQIDEGRNVILITGTSSEIATVREAISIFDVDTMRGMSFALFPTEEDPEAMSRQLDAVFANDGSGPTTGMVRVVPNRALKSILVIARNRAYLRKAEEWVSRIGRAAAASERKVHVYHVQYRPAAELAALLDKVYQPRARAETSMTSLATATPAMISSPEARTGDAASASSAIVPIASGPADTLGGGVVSGLAAAARPAADQRGASGFGAMDPSSSAMADDTVKIVSDDANNSIIITATEVEFGKIRKILSQIDVAPPQVLLEATIAEVTLNDNLHFGLRWFFEKGGNNLKLTNSAIGAVSSAFPGFSYMLNMSNVQVVLNALSDVTTVNVISSPSLMVLDNKRAQLQVGDEVPIATQSAVSTTSPGAPIVNSVTFRSTGIILGITPRISDNGRILLDIEQEVSDVVPTTTSTIDSPTIQQRRVKTTVAVTNGESVVLAGLMKDRSHVKREQVPGIGQLPVLGNLFTDKNDKIGRTELLIAITPQVVADRNAIRNISNEFRDRLNISLRPQHEAGPDAREQLDRLAR